MNSETDKNEDVPSFEFQYKCVDLEVHKVSDKTTHIRTVDYMKYLTLDVNPIKIFSRPYYSSRKGAALESESVRKGINL